MQHVSHRQTSEQSEGRQQSWHQFKTVNYLCDCTAVMNASHAVLTAL